jgi:hypothetical protein
VTDVRVRELERRFKATGTVDDEAAWLMERVRVGELAHDRVALAARLGHEASQACARDPLQFPPDPEAPPAPEGWLRRLIKRWRGPAPVSERPWIPYALALPEAEAKRLRDEARLAGPVDGQTLQRLSKEGAIVTLGSRVRYVDDQVFDAAARVGRDALLRISIAAVRLPVNSLRDRSAEVLKSVPPEGHRQPHQQRNATNWNAFRDQALLCQEAIELAEASVLRPDDGGASSDLMQRLNDAVSHGQFNYGCYISGPDFGYTVRCSIAAYLLADSVGTDDPKTLAANAMDAVSHSAGYFVERAHPRSDGVVIHLPLQDWDAAGERVYERVRAEVIPWALSYQDPVAGRNRFG